MSPPQPPRNHAWGRGRGRGTPGDGPPRFRKPASPDATRSWNRGAWGDASNAGPAEGSSGGWGSAWSMQNPSSATDPPPKDSQSTSTTSWEDLINREADQVQSTWGTGNSSTWGDSSESLWDVNKPKEKLGAPKVPAETAKPIEAVTPFKLPGVTRDGNGRVQAGIPPRNRVVDSSNPRPVKDVQANIPPRTRVVDSSDPRLVKDPAIAKLIEKANPSDYRTEVIRRIIVAVKRQLELNQMDADDKKWTLDQESPFHNVQLEDSAREMLNKRRMERQQMRARLERGLSDIVSNLAQLPETSRSSLEVFDPEIDGKELTKYVRDLFAWIGTVRKSLIALTKQAHMHVHQEDQSMEPSPAKRRRLDSGGSHKTPPMDASFEACLGDMETRLEWLLNHHGLDIKEGTGVISSDAILDVESHLPPEIDTQATTARRDGTAVLSSLPQARSEAQQKEFLEENANLLKLRMESAERQQLESQAERTNIHIEQLSKQLEGLQVRHPSASNLDDIISSVVRSVVDTQLPPFLNNFTRNVEDTHLHIYGALREKMEPTLALTEGIQTWLKSKRGSTSSSW